MIVALMLALASVGTTQGTPAATPGAPPTYLVERIVTVGDDTRRLSVFRDGTAVLVRRTGGTVVEELRRELSALELAAIGKVVAECAAELGRAGVLDRGPGGATLALRLAPLEGESQSWTLPLAAVPNLATARLTAALDGLECALAQQRAGRDELETWHPSAGDRLELEDGRTVTILELRETDAGTLAKVQIGPGPLTFFADTAELRRMAVRRIEP